VEGSKTNVEADWQRKVLRKSTTFTSTRNLFFLSGSVVTQSHSERLAQFTWSIRITIDRMHAVTYFGSVRCSSDVNVCKRVDGSLMLQRPAARRRSVRCVVCKVTDRLHS